MNAWELNAQIAEREYGVQVDWKERFYCCPECGEPVYEADWSEEQMVDWLCPICEFDE